MSKNHCYKCNKETNKLISVFLDSNEYEFFCNECFRRIILTKPTYLNRTLTIRYYKYE